MPYRTRTYIAADWSEDFDAVERLREWNDSDHWSLSFSDAHDLKQARDCSLNCNIKKSLKDRLDASKTFILIVGKNTSELRAGACRYCYRYNGELHWCRSNYTVDNHSYIEYECAKAIESRMKIVVLYKSVAVNKTRCPECIRNIGSHIPMYRTENGIIYWNYQEIKEVLE